MPGRTDFIDAKVEKEIYFPSLIDLEAAERRRCVQYEEDLAALSLVLRCRGSLCHTEVRRRTNTNIYEAQPRS
jgi:hypothetical protein